MFYKKIWHMKTTMLALIFLFALPFIGFSQNETDKELKDEVDEVKREVQEIFKDLEDERIFARVDSILNARWPELEAQIEEAWQKAEPKIEEVEARIEEIADEIIKEVEGELEEKPAAPQQPRKRKEM